MGDTGSSQGRPGGLLEMMLLQPIRVLIADDSVRVRAGLRALLGTWPEIEVIGEVPNGREAVHFVEEHRAMVVLMDLCMPIMDGIQATRLIKYRWPDVYIIVVTMNATEQASALAAGADAFVVKGDAPEQLRIALHTSSEFGVVCNHISSFGS